MNRFQADAKERSEERSRLADRPDLTYDQAHDIFIPNYEPLTSKNVWLTFDDGPHPLHTPAILAALAAASLKATFFIVGVNAARHPQVLARIHGEGHRIANHSYSHADLTTLTESQVRNEISRTDSLISPYVGADKIFRPPYGASNATVNRVMTGLGYRSVLWTVDTEDWKASRQPDGWVAHGLDQVRSKPSCLVLMHDIHSGTAANLGTFIAGIRAIPNTVFKAPGTL